MSADSESSGIGRRNLLRTTGLAALAGFGLSGCGSAFAAGMAGTGTSRETLTYWTLLGGGDGGRMVTMEEAYQKQNPDVKLQATTLAWGNPYYTKLSLATLGNQPPDVGIAHLTRASVLAQANLLEPLGLDELARFGMGPDTFTPAAWKQAQTNGRVYAIPLDTHPFVMYYNTDVCSKAGLLNPDGTLKDIDGPDGLVNALTAAKKVTGQYGGVLSINGDTATCWRVFATLYYQLGGTVLGSDGTKVVLDHDKAEQVLSYLQKLTSTGLLPGSIDYGGTTTAFATNQAGFFFQGDWEVTTFITAKTKFSMTRFPHVFTEGAYACQADSHSFVLPRDDKRDPARRTMILKFIRGLLDQSDVWAAGGHIPAWLPFQDSAAYQKIKPQSNYADVANSAHYDDPGWYSGSGSDFENIMGSIIGAVLAGQLKPAQAISQMVTKLTKYANTPSPV